MSAGGRAASMLTAAGVIGFGWWYGTQDSTATTSVVADTPSTSATSSSSSSSAASSGSSSSAASSSSPSSSSSTSAASGKSGTFTGNAASDRYGQLTVTVVESKGKISNITYTSTAGDGHSQQIESQAIPTLKSEAIAANSANIDSVSGATYTSTKYKTSLQSALDKA